MKYHKPIGLLVTCIHNDHARTDSHVFWSTSERDAYYCSKATQMIVIGHDQKTGDAIVLHPVHGIIISAQTRLKGV